MQYSTINEHNVEPSLPSDYWEVSDFVEIELAENDNELFESSLNRIDEFAEYYLHATQDLSLIIERNKALLKPRKKLGKLVKELVVKFQDAATGDFQAIKEASNNGEYILLKILDALEDIGVKAEYFGNHNKYAKLESELTEFHRQYF